MWDAYRYDGRLRMDEGFSRPTTKKERELEASAAELSEKMHRGASPAILRQQQAGTLRVVRRGALGTCVRDQLGLRQKVTTEDLLPSLPSDLHAGSVEDAGHVFLGANNMPRRAFWEPFATTGEPSLWAAARGLAVVTPCNLSSNPGCHILHDVPLRAC